MATETRKRQRSCIACGKQAGKAELYRVVRTPAGSVAFDGTGRAPGGGRTYAPRRASPPHARPESLNGR